MRRLTICLMGRKRPPCALHSNLIRVFEMTSRFLFLICAVFFILCMGCGVKAPPVAPRATVPPSIEDLEAEVVGETVRLTWSVPREGDVVFEGLEHFTVYRRKFHRSVEQCPGCPMPFERVLDIKPKAPEPARVEGNRIIWHDQVAAGHRYAYKVVVYHKSGGMSEDSNIVQFVTTNFDGIVKSPHETAK